MAGMDDITALILDDHHSFRVGFARLDDAREPAQLAAIWSPLALHLDIHAEAEESILYPHLLKKAARHGQAKAAGEDARSAEAGGDEAGGGDAEEETDDAIRDHNKIRDAVAEAARHPVGSDEWWSAVWTARTENSEHLAEEEDEVLPDFRRRASFELRAELAAQWLTFYGQHQEGKGLTFADKDPRKYVEENS
jgi:hypothetical protein